MRGEYVPGDVVWVVHPTEDSYRWVIDGPLTVQKVILDDSRRQLYRFKEFQKSNYRGYVSDTVFSTLQDAVQFRTKMLRKYPYNFTDSDAKNLEELKRLETKLGN